MKKLLAVILSALPHLNISLAAVLIACFIIDKFNPMMEFMSSEVTNYTVCILCVLSLIQSLVYIAYKRKQK